MTDDPKIQTPWQRVAKRFAVHPAELAREIGRHRSKISRALRDPEGLISGRDQKLLLATAKRLHVELEPTDFIPGAK